MIDLGVKLQWVGGVVLVILLLATPKIVEQMYYLQFHGIPVEATFVGFAERPNETFRTCRYTKLGSETWCEYLVEYEFNGLYKKSSVIYTKPLISRITLDPRIPLPGEHITLLVDPENQEKIVQKKTKIGLWSEIVIGVTTFFFLFIVLLKNLRRPSYIK